MREHVVLIMRLLCLAILIQVSTQRIITTDLCCGKHVMSRPVGRAVLEVDRVVAPGTYNGVTLFMCSTDPFHVQLWRRNNDSDIYQLYREQIFTPLETHLGRDLVLLLDRNWTVPDDPLFIFVMGYFSSSGVTLGVPYEFGDEYNLHITISSFHRGISEGDTATVDNLKWPHRILASLVECTAHQCTTMNDAVVNPPGDTAGSCCDEAGPPGPQGEPGPPGPQGPSGALDLPPGGLTCDFSEQVNDNLYGNTQKLDLLRVQVADVYAIMTGLTNSDYPTGFCPRDFDAGSYGIGSCYKVVDIRVQMAVAALHCIDNYGATLVRIDSQIEDNFINRIIANKTRAAEGSRTNMWTAGMYSRGAGIWTWYTDSGKKGKIPFAYENWNGTSPIPRGNDMCLYVSAGKDDYSWRHSDCAANRFFICELVKRCF